MPRSIPATKELLWNALATQKYQEVFDCIIEKPDLINSKTEEDKSLVLGLLTILTFKENEAVRGLLTYIAQQENFKTFSHKSVNGLSPIRTIFSIYDPTILDIFIEKPYVIYNGSELSCKEAQKALGMAEATLAREHTKDPNSEKTKKAQSNVEIKRSMRDKIYAKTMERDSKILDAIKTNQISILIQLEREGSFNVLLSLVTGQDWKALAQQQGKTEIVAWYETVEKRRVEMEAFDKSIAALVKTSTNLAKQQQQAAAKHQELSLGYQQEVNGASSELLANTEASMRGLTVNV